MTRTTIACLTLAIMALLAGVAGCGGKKGGGSPEAVAQQFVAALQAADWSKAADLMAWDAIAAASNSDWDSFPASQRSLIIKKLKEQQQPQLQALAQRLADARVGAAHISGEVATVTLQGSGGTATMSLRKTKSGWGVYSVQ
ncbi:MAG: hypothetical protein J7M26_04920 [Armatimonadetes bacterium]|nr:hypothetical protein [Armatimonadota bacterium]